MSKYLLYVVRHFGLRQCSFPRWFNAAGEEGLAARGAAVLSESVQNLVSLIYSDLEDFPPAKVHDLCYE